MRRGDSSPPPRIRFESTAFDYSFTGPAGTMDGIDGWAFDAVNGVFTVNRDGGGNAVPSDTLNACAIAHPVGPVDLSTPWSLSFVCIYPTAPFAALAINVQLMASDKTPLAGIQIYGLTDGSRPLLQIRKPTGVVPGVVPNDPIGVAINFKLVYDGVNTLNLYQNGALLTNLFPVTIAPAIATLLGVVIQDGVDLPLASVSRVSVPGLP